MKLLLILLSVFTLFFPVRSGFSITITPIYDDAPGTGFKDRTTLGGTSLFSLSMQFPVFKGNNAATLGEARKVAFEHALGIIGKNLQGGNEITVTARFVSFSDTRVIGSVSRSMVSNDSYRLPEIFYTCALAETIGVIPQKCEDHPLNIQSDFIIRLSDRHAFYYGLDRNPPSNYTDFISVVLHETLHGLGITSNVMYDGGFTLAIPSAKPRKSIYDLQIYSELHNEFFLRLTDEERADAIVSETGLSWDGTSENANQCSYARRMSELQSSGVNSNGMPLLFAPATFSAGSSVKHVSPNIGDIMQPRYPLPADMSVSLGMLQDIGWEINDSAFPPSCVPTGITASTSTGTGGEAAFTLKLDSEPMSNVRISATSSSGEVSISPTDLLFTPSDWDNPQEITVTASGSSRNTGLKTYQVNLGITSTDKFYNRFDPDDVFVRLDARNDDGNDRSSAPDPPADPANTGTGSSAPDPPADPANTGTGSSAPDPPTNPANAGTGSTSGGCSISGEKQVQVNFLSSVLYLVVLLVFFSEAIQRK